MADKPWDPARRTPFAGEAPDEYRTRVLQQQADTAERRRQDLKDQASTLKTPAARIRVWERLHQARLPKEATHGLVAVIAANTGLTTEQVQDEQRERLRGVPTTGGTPTT
ncbi:MAG: hypothetical protein ABIX37_01990 [Gammaproteobacteria bacterium]